MDVFIICNNFLKDFIKNLIIENAQYKPVTHFQTSGFLKFSDGIKWKIGWKCVNS